MNKEQKSQYNKTWRARNPGYMNERREAVRKEVEDYKEAQGCEQCPSGITGNLNRAGVGMTNVGIATRAPRV